MFDRVLNTPLASLCWQLFKIIPEILMNDKMNIERSLPSLSGNKLAMRVILLIMRQVVRL